MTNPFLSLAAADWIIVGIISISALISLLRGFTKESLSLGGWLLASFAAAKFYPLFNKLFLPYCGDGILATICSVVAIFTIILLANYLLSKLLVALIDKIGLGYLDHLLGLIFGLARGFLLVIVLTMVLQATNHLDEPFWKNSLFIPWLSRLSTWFTQLVLPYLKRLITK